MPKVKGQLVEHSEGDEKLIRRLGRAVALQWMHLPEPVQKRILQQAWTVFDAEPVSPQLKRELEAFVNKHQLQKELVSNASALKAKSAPNRPTKRQRRKRWTAGTTRAAQPALQAKECKRAPDPNQRATVTHPRQKQKRAPSEAP